MKDFQGPLTVCKVNLCILCGCFLEQDGMAIYTVLFPQENHTRNGRVCSRTCTYIIVKFVKDFYCSYIRASAICRFQHSRPVHSCHNSKTVLYPKSFVFIGHIPDLIVLSLL